MSEETQLLVSAETYEENAVNIGTQQKSADMSRFIDRVREDGLYLLDIATTDQRIRSIAALLNTYDAPSIMVVSATIRPASCPHVRRSNRCTLRCGPLHSRLPDQPALRSYIEPDILFVTDPANDQQALREAVASGLPIVGIVDANNHLRNVDIALPANNKGRRSLALIYWLLAREVLKVRGETTDEAWAEANELSEWESTF